MGVLRISHRLPVLCASATLGLMATQDAAQAAGTEPTLSGQTAVVDGVELKYLAAGSGPPLILLHGYTETSHMWEAVIPHFARAFRVVAPDLPGIGGSA